LISQNRAGMQKIAEELVQKVVFTI
jgi:hypothetical protein